MIVTVSIRQIAPGSYDAFREAWEPQQWWPGLAKAQMLRHEESPERILTLGIFDLGKEEFDEMRDLPSVHEEEDRRLQRMAPFEERLLLNAVFELVEEVAPQRAGVASSHEARRNPRLPRAAGAGRRGRCRALRSGAAPFRTGAR